MQPKIYTENEHSIRQDDIDQDALDIIFHLKNAGYTAYLVGGGVRDLLLHKKPKDYDISTSARPEEVKRLFQRRCLLIGKRFRLAHIRHGKKVFECATFRAGDLENASLIVRDNQWGNAEEDVLRRDFTINALFYDPTTRTVIDYVNGVEDIRHKILRTIGDPMIRFKQDPVRMIRLLKFHARFGFSIDHKTERALHACKEEIMKSAPARLLEEFFKMLESGYASAFLDLMAAYDFLLILFPCFHHFLWGPSKTIAHEYLRAIDDFHRIRPAPLHRSILLAAIVFPILEQELNTLTQDRGRPLSMQDVLHLSETLLNGIDTTSFAHFPRRLMMGAHLVTTNQFRLTPFNTKPKFHGRFTKTEEFYYSLQFLGIRTKVRHELKDIYEDWKKSAGKA